MAPRYFDKLLVDQIREVLQQHGVDPGKPTVTRDGSAFRVEYPNGDMSEHWADPDNLAMRFEDSLRTAMELCLIADEGPTLGTSTFGWGIRRFLGKLR